MRFYRSRINADGRKEGSRHEWKNGESAIGRLWTKTLRYRVSRNKHFDRATWCRSSAVLPGFFLEIRFVAGSRLRWTFTSSLFHLFRVFSAIDRRSALNYRVQYAIVRNGYATRRLAELGKRRLTRRKETFRFDDVNATTELFYSQCSLNKSFSKVIPLSNIRAKVRVN